MALQAGELWSSSVNALKTAGIDTEFHKFPNLSHGIGLGTGTSAEG